MSDLQGGAPVESGEAGFESGFGERRGRGERRGGRGRGRGRGRRGGADEKKEWQPVTKLGRLVKANLIRLEDIYTFSLAIKESEILDHYLGSDLKDEVMKISPVQKQTRAGQRTRFKAIVIVGDKNGHIGLGVKVASEVANAIRGALIAAKMAVIPIRLGHWGSTFGPAHTVPCKVSGKCGSVLFRIIPAPRGTGLVAAGAIKKVLVAAGVTDAYTTSSGKTKTLGNFIKAAYAALSHTNAYLTPDRWVAKPLTKSPYQEHTDFLKEKKEKSYK